MREARQTTRILLASLVGTSVEFYDFYIYATATSLVFGPLFFPASSASAQLLSSYASFGLAFLARPLGGALFGHFGDRIGRKSTLVASLLLMGISTAAIAFLPTYAMVGWLAPALLCLLRFGQGIGLGQKTLMDGIRAEAAVDITRPDDLRRNPGVDLLLGKSASGILGKE